MKDLNLEKHLADFLERYVPKDEPFYIAFSGGPDSTALLYALKSVTEEREIHVVHIDHGWREESAREAMQLKELVASLGFFFHSRRLSPPSSGENLEDWSRRERLRYFSELGATIVLLAHHADDQIEIVLKRFLEGSSVKHFRGMRCLEKREGLTLMRPLLPFRKKELLSWLQKRNIPYLIDPTNKDPKFLRARFRETLLPFLRKSFGKEFEESLLRVSEEALLLDEWLQESLDRAFSYGKGNGIAYATATSENVSAFQICHMIDELRKEMLLPPPSRSQLREATSVFLGKPSGSRCFPVGGGVILVEHGWTGVFSHKGSPLTETLCEGDIGEKNLSGWEIRWNSCLYEKAFDMASWQQLLQGTLTTIFIPQESFKIFRASDKLLRSVPKRSSSPTSLRSFFPVFLQENRVVADLLARFSPALTQGEKCYEIVVQWKGFD